MAGWSDEERRAELARREKESLETERAQTANRRPPNAECAICHRHFYSYDPGAEFLICETCD